MSQNTTQARRPGLVLRRWAALPASLALSVCLLAPTASASPAGSNAFTSNASIKTSSGDLVTYVDRFVTGIPGMDSGGYYPANSSETSTFLDGVEAVLRDDLFAAAATLDSLQYDVIRYTDTGVYPNRTMTVLRERLVDGKYGHGWGLYVFGRADSRVVVEVPHPKFDMETDRVGALAFRRAHAKALLVAGTHRYANGRLPEGQDSPADMAHADNSIFQSVHIKLSLPDVRVFQPHGFGGELGLQYADNHEVVVSAGAQPTALTTGVATSVERHFSTCLSTGPSVCYYFASHNEQGKWTRKVGGEFVHVESYTPIRTDAALRTTLAHSVSEVLEPVAGK